MRLSVLVAAYKISSSLLWSTSTTEKQNLEITLPGRT